MTTWQKRLEKVRRSRGRNVSQEEFESLVRSFGHIEEGGKHAKAIIGNHTLTYKRENPVKSAYVVELLELIDGLPGARVMEKPLVRSNLNRKTK